jgi:hypothetical protein
VNQFLVFNHHSLPFDSKESAISAIPEFLKICIKANNLGFSTILIDDSIDKDWFRLKLTGDYYWQDWYNQNNSDQQKDLIRAFRSIQTRQPFFSSEYIGAGLNLYEVKVNDSGSYSAIHAAAWYESPIVSFPTHEPWDTSPIQIEVNSMEQENEEIVSSRSEIINFYSISIVKDCEPDLLKIRTAAILSANEIFEKQKDIYPYIKFCGESLEQLKKWSNSSTLLEQVKESISALNLFSEKWNSNEFAAYSHENLRKSGLNHEVSGESLSVIRNPTFRKEREFWLPDGRKVLFENHIKISQGHRIHFYADSESKRIFIGYIGRHLK